MLGGTGDENDPYILEDFDLHEGMQAMHLHRAPQQQQQQQQPQLVDGYGAFVPDDVPSYEGVATRRGRPRPMLHMPEQEELSFRIDGGMFITEDMMIGDDGLVFAEADQSSYPDTPDDYEEMDEMGSVSPDHSIQPESRIRYEDIKVFEVLGHGNSSVVHRAAHTSGLQLALKTVSLDDRGRRHQIVREINSMINMDCPNLVKFYGAVFRDNAIELALELMDRGVLSGLMECCEQVPEVYMCYVAKCVLQGLDYLHREQRQIHRDLKPGNICLNSAGEVKVADFGIARVMEDQVEADTFVGTTFYMSPERVQGAKYSFSCDVWSLGITVLECITGEFPYDTSVLVAFLSSILEDPSPKPPPGFSPELESFLSLALEKDPNKRATAEDLLQHPWIRGCRVSKEHFARFLVSVQQAVEDE